MNWSLPTEIKKLPLVMGVINTTPDSFSDGGKYLALDDACEQVAHMIDAGVDIIDIGGESTRPGADEVSVEHELQRVIPLIDQIRLSFNIPISVDTSKAVVMRAALDAGANMINDVTALVDPAAMKVVSAYQVPVCVMHMQGLPRTMQKRPRYNDVVNEVRDYLVQRVTACVCAGIEKSQIVVDPGFGFGKNLEHNLQLFQALKHVAHGQPVLVGVSRKSMIGQVLDRSVDHRLSGSLALASLATWMHAAIIRVHDVAETVDAIRMVRAVRDVAYTAPTNGTSKCRNNSMRDG